MSSISTRPTANLFQRVDKKMLIAVAGFLAAVVVGATSLVGATPVGKPTKAWCAQQGYSNYGQCVRAWSHGSGYGGGDNGSGNDDENRAFIRQILLAFMGWWNNLFSWLGHWLR